MGEIEKLGDGDSISQRPKKVAANFESSTDAGAFSSYLVTLPRRLFPRQTPLAQVIRLTHLNAEDLSVRQRGRPCDADFSGNLRCGFWGRNGHGKFGLRAVHYHHYRVRQRRLNTIGIPH